MDKARWIAIAVVFVAFAAGALLRRFSVRLGLSFQVCASVLARLLGAAALAWAATRMLDQPDALRICAAVLFALLALSFVVGAAVLLVGLIYEIRHASATASE